MLQLKLNIDKCLVLHLGKANPMFVHTINATKLLAPDYVVDLGISQSKNLNCHEHVQSVIVDYLLSKKCLPAINEDILLKL